MSDLRIDRRTAILWAASLAAAFSGGLNAFAMAAAPAGAMNPGTGYGLDPNINEGKTPWPNTFTPEQSQTAVALCDFLLPAEGDSPSASQIGVHAMLDEWISAPYPEQLADRALILDGFEWLNAQAVNLGGSAFCAATAAVQRAVLEQLSAPHASEPPAGFYRKIRRLVIGGYYTTAEGFKDIGYIGNVPLSAFPQPSAEVQGALERAFDALGLKA